MQNDKQRDPERHMGGLALLFMGITSIIGSGWLFASMYAAQIAGPASIISWAIGGFITMILALIFAELGGSLPVSGALAKIPWFSHGNLNSYVAGYLSWISYVAIAPIEVTAVLEYAGGSFPNLIREIQGDKSLSAEGLGIAVILMMFFTAVNMAGIRWLSRATSMITFIKLSIPIIAPVALIVVAFDSSHFSESGGFAPYGWTGILGAVSSGGIIFSFVGFRATADFAGEVKNPMRNVPFAMIGSIIICIVVYALLQVAFIGAIPADHLKDGWKGISESVPGGPFALFASLYGMPLLAAALYGDAAISPSGTALAYVGTTARINYAMAKSRQIPAIFCRLTRSRVPGWSLIFNFFAGLMLFLPFPGWQQMVAFISSACVLCLGFGPITLAALRLQAPDLQRPFRLPWSTGFCACSFVLVGFVVYWTGWNTNWKVIALVVAGLVLFVIFRMAGIGRSEPLHLKSFSWFPPWLLCTTLVSYYGNFGGGKGILPAGTDMLVIAVYSLIFFFYALQVRLPAEQTLKYLQAENINN